MRFSILILFILSASCEIHRKELSKFDEVPSSDTLCIKNIEKAKADIAKGKLIYFHHAGSLLYIPLRSHAEADSIFKRYGIGFDEYVTSDVEIPGERQGCYQEYMNENLAKRVGQGFIDSVLFIGDSVYISKNLNKLFASNECETEPEYPGDTLDNNPNFNPGLQLSFDSKIQYPKKYLYKKKKDEFALANFNLEIDTFGKAKINQSYFVFSNEANHRFEIELRRVFEPLILNTRWAPATIKHQRVNSTMITFLYFK